jgi:hypothetical protein
MRKPSTNLKLAVIATFALYVAGAFAQMNVAEAGGVVVDPAGDGIVGAVITATNTATGSKLSASTGPAGKYLLSYLAPASTT